MRNLSYFQFVRIYSACECVLFTSLLVVWIGGLSDSAKTVLGWTHGFGWILLCLLVLYGWLRRIFPGPLLAATVSPLGPLGSTIGFEVLRLRDMAAGTAIGALPRTFAYVALGGSLDDLGSPEAIAALVLLVLTAIVGAVVARHQIVRERSG